TTEAIGIHAVFGAFLVGVLIPHDSRLARDVGRKLFDVVTVLLLPAFFAFTGLRTEIGLVSSGSEWAMCAAIVCVATIGKFGGGAVAARLTGQRWRDAAAVGSLMNTRGLMELIVLNIGLDLGVISPTLFAMMVIMALITTMATAPALHFLLPHHQPTPPDEAWTSEERPGPAAIASAPVAPAPSGGKDVGGPPLTPGRGGFMASPPVFDVERLLAPIPGDNPAGSAPPFDLVRQLDDARKEGDPFGPPRKMDWPGI